MHNVVPKLWGVYVFETNYVFVLVVLEGPGPPAGPVGLPGMPFPAKVPMGFGQIDDLPILAPIRDVFFFVFCR